MANILDGHLGNLVFAWSPQNDRTGDESEKTEKVRIPLAIRWRTWNMPPSEALTTVRLGIYRQCAGQMAWRPACHQMQVSHFSQWLRKVRIDHWAGAESRPGHGLFVLGRWGQPTFVPLQICGFCTLTVLRPLQSADGGEWPRLRLSCHRTASGARHYILGRLGRGSVCTF
jgi:hypothetical protein